jgi:hypothetical protein
MTKFKIVYILLNLLIIAFSCTERQSEKSERTYTGDKMLHISPRIIAPDSIFVNTLKVELACSLKTIEIYYSLDGSSPDQNSKRYKKPILLRESKLLKAHAYYSGKKIGGIVEKEFTKVLPKPSFSINGLINGLQYEYYQGEWNKLPVFTDLEPVLTGIIQEISLKVRQRDNYFGIRITGYIRVKRDNVYQFALLSDDGSRLYIGNILVVDNDGLHNAKEKIGSIALARGVHPFTLTYFNHAGDKQLQLRIAETGGKLHDIVSEDLYYKP